MRDNLLLFIIVGISLFYFLLIQSRRYRWRAMAHRLGAKYFSMGLFKTGRITGMIEGRKYFVATDVNNSGVIMPFAYKGIPLGLPTKFFTSFPDWRYALTIGEKRQRCFVTHVTFKGASIQLPEAYRDRVVEAFQELRMFYPPEDHRIGDGYLWLRAEGVEFKCSGVFFDSERIKAIASLLCSTAELMEKLPILEVTGQSAPRDSLAPLDP